MAPPTPWTPWTHLRRYRGRIALGVLCLAGTTGLALAVPWMIKLAVESLQRRESAAAAGHYALIIGVLAIALGLIRIASRMCFFDAARRAEFDLRNDLFAQLMRLPPSWYRGTSTGDVMSRLTVDVQNARLMWGPGLLNLVNTGFMYVIALGLMARISPFLTLCALLPYPLLVLAGRRFMARVFTLSRQVQEQLGAMSASVQEDLAGIAVVKAYTLEAARARRWDGLADTYLERNLALAKARGQMMPVLGALGSLGLVVVLWLGGRAVAKGELSLGSLIAFQAYLALLIWPTLALGFVMSLFQRGLASWARVAGILGETPSIQDGAGAPLDPTAAGAVAAAGRIEVRGLTVAIDGRKLLCDVSLEVPAGSLCAIVGRTGAGKTTLVEALPRLIEIPAGTVFLDGRDVTELPLASLRDAIGYAPQDAFLFSATIGENIELGRRPPPGESAAARDAAVRRAAETAGLAHDLTALPHGLDTIVGERGITLSGGQRQRVALARALARAPRVLILDDSLSSVDVDTEREILRGLEGALVGRTAIIVSHRLAAVAAADRIVVLDRGRVAETGTHAELLARGGIYAELYREQLAEAEDAAAKVVAGANPT